jgi:HPt (histidine-containing phosphotransfer) domain-containing protein
MAYTKLYSLDALKTMSGGNNEFVKKMCDIFITMVPHGVEKIKKGWENGDLRVVFQHAHQIKSNINHLSIEVLKPVIADIERMAYENEVDTGRMSALIATLDETIALVVKEIKEELI